MAFKRTSLSFIPSLLPNQTLYSWGAVFHEQSGNSSAERSRSQLFGLVRRGLHFHIPSHLDKFCANTQLALGTPETLIQIATTVPYYTRFRTPSVSARILKLARGNSSYGVAQALGMAKTTIYTPPPRRSCYQCVQDDLAELGFAYWRRDHQLPGILVCPKHGKALLSLPYDHRDIHNDKFLWPDEDWNLMGASANSNWPTTTLVTLNRLAKLATDMANDNLTENYSLRKMRSAFLSILHKRGLIAPDGSLEVTPALRDYGHHFCSVLKIPEIAAAEKTSIRPIVYVLRHTKFRIHPLEWMLLIDWLFGDWSTFIEYYSHTDMKQQ